MLTHTLAHPGSNGPLPTLVALHGYASHARDLIGLWPYLADGQLLMICAQAPHAIEGGEGPSYSWSGSETDGDVSVREIVESGRLVDRFMDELIAAYPVDPKRVALLGYSQGGMVAARVGLAAPGRLAGLALLSTTTDEERAGNLTVAPDAGRLPVLIQHGASDAAIPIVEAFSTSMRLQGLGLKPELQQYAMKNEINLESAEALSTWLKQVLHIDGG